MTWEGRQQRLLENQMFFCTVLYLQTSVIDRYSWFSSDEILPCLMELSFHPFSNYLQWNRYSSFGRDCRISRAVTTHLLDIRGPDAHLALNTCVDRSVCQSDYGPSVSRDVTFEIRLGHTRWCLTVRSLIRWEQVSYLFSAINNDSVTSTPRLDHEMRSSGIFSVKFLEIFNLSSSQRCLFVSPADKDDFWVVVFMMYDRTRTQTCRHVDAYMEIELNTSLKNAFAIRWKEDLNQKKSVNP